MTAKTNANRAVPERRYRAPALDKGLDVLEFLAGEPNPTSFSKVAEVLGRSKSELFRVMQTLEERGFVKRSEGEKLELTNKLFGLGLARPCYRLLLEIAPPLMKRIAASIDQSCHLAVPSEDEMVVVHRVEGGGSVGFAVRVGHRRKLAGSASGHVLLAFQGGEASTGRTFDEIRAQGHVGLPSEDIVGVTDVSVPILVNGIAVAALTIPFVQRRHSMTTSIDAIAILKENSATIGAQLAPQ